MIRVDCPLCRGPGNECWDEPLCHRINLARKQRNADLYGRLCALREDTVIEILKPVPERKWEDKRFKELA